jgi:hypothetical protein
MGLMTRVNAQRALGLFDRNNVGRVFKVFEAGLLGLLALGSLLGYPINQRKARRLVSATRTVRGVVFKMAGAWVNVIKGRVVAREPGPRCVECLHKSAKMTLDEEWRTIYFAECTHWS